MRIVPKIYGIYCNDFFLTEKFKMPKWLLFLQASHLLYIILGAQVAFLNEENHWALFQEKLKRTASQEWIKFLFIFETTTFMLF